MKFNLISKNDNSKVILFFNGWGQDHSIINHLDRSSYDIIAFSDYDDDFTIDESVLQNYSEINVVAWSMGVWACAKALQNTRLKLKRSIAINGTLRPIDDNKGISDFIKDVVAPIEFHGIEIKENSITINAGRQSKAALIGRNRKREKELTEVLKNFFKITKFKII